MTYAYVDLHCHPSMKPYGKSFNIDPGRNSVDPNDDNSIWFYDSPNFFERAIQLFSGICKFTQSDCTTLAHGNVRVACVSLYPIERGFFRNKLGSGLPSELADSFVTSVGMKRVDFIQNNKNYFQDLLLEYKYCTDCANLPTPTDSGDFKYIIATDFTAVEQAMASDEKVIILVLTIEGMHVLHEDIDNPDEHKATQNVQLIKSWPHVPFFVTLAHHFNNHFCGHAKSLFGVVGKFTDQSDNLDEPLNAAGRKIIHALLSTTNGKRIHIDIKHMSTKARTEYFEMLRNDPDLAGEGIPIIISHGAANGRRSAKEKVIDIKETGPMLLNEDINFYDDEIIAMAKSNGIIGFQLDERRIANPEALKRIKHSPWIGKIRHYRAALLWNQVQHIVELLDRNDVFAWDCMAIGSDFDGMVDPLNGFLTEETLVHLEEYLERYAFDYMKTRGPQVLKSFNLLPADEIVQRIFHSNAMDFMRRYFK